MTNKCFKRICVACLLAASVCLGPEVPAERNPDGLVMQKGSFGLLPGADNPLGSEVVVDVLEKKAKEPGEASTSKNTTAPNSNGQAQGSSGTKDKVGPSIMTQIVTQGEKGATHEAMLGGAKVTMLQSTTGQQILSCIIQTSQGKLIVIDGGFGADSANLLNALSARGGHVGAWLLTHPHADHAGALFEILENKERNLTIDGVYYSLADANWYTQKDPKDAEMAHAMINTLSQMPAEMLHGDIAKGYEIMVDDVRIEVMNSRYDISADAGNNASMVYKITVNGKNLLFLGDMGEAGGTRLLAESGDNLKADIVQMAHHGQNGVTKEVYEKINPTICLWPTPQWLWDNNKGTGVNSGSWPIATTKAWMNQINESILHYAVKDGEFTIE